MEWRGGNHIVPVDFRDDHLPEAEDERMEWDTCFRCGGSGYVQPDGYDAYCPECNDPPGECGAGVVLYPAGEPRPWDWP
jgi:hypothetical protein